MNNVLVSLLIILNFKLCTNFQLKKYFTNMFLSMIQFYFISFFTDLPKINIKTTMYSYIQQRSYYIQTLIMPLSPTQRQIIPIIICTFFLTSSFHLNRRCPKGLFPCYLSYDSIFYKD